MVYKSLGIITIRNTVQFTKILIEKEEQFLDVRTIRIQNKIRYYILTYLEEYK